MEIIKGSCWSIGLLPDWVGEHEEDCTSIYHQNGVGALQVSAYTTDGKVTKEDLEDLASDHIEAGAKLAETKAGEFQGYTFAFGIESTFWQHWYLSAGNTALFITYNCDVADREHEIENIKEMVKTLKAT